MPIEETPDVYSMTVSELQELARSNDLDTRVEGRDMRKAELQDMLADHYGYEDADDADDEEEKQDGEWPAELEPPAMEPLEQPPEAPPEAVAAATAAGEKPKRSIDYFMVEEDCMVFVNGYGQKLAQGSIVCRKTHDLDTIRSQGAKLVPSGEPRPQLDGWGKPVADLGRPDHLPPRQHVPPARSGESFRVVDGERVILSGDASNPQHPAHDKRLWARVI